MGDEDFVFVELVLELFPVDGFSTGSVAIGEVTSLAHKTWDNPVEAGSLVVEWLAFLAGTLFSGAQGSEIFRCLGGYRFEQLHLDASGLFAVDFNVEKDTWVFLAGDAVGITVLDQKLRGFASTFGSIKVVSMVVFVEFFRIIVDVVERKK